MIRALALGAALFGAPLQAADYYFCWTGGNGYTMTGQMSLDPAALTQPLVTEGQVRAFKIAGYRDGALIGKWDMATRAPDAPWLLYFYPQTMAFATPADLGLGVTQAWNAGGMADDCGDPGFGFNLGDYAQDFCLNNVWVEASGMPPDTPFMVTTQPVDPSCRLYTPLS